MKKGIKMWCLCRKKDGKPMNLDVIADDGTLMSIIGLATKKNLISVAKGIDKDEEVRKIIFKY